MISVESVDIYKSIGYEFLNYSLIIVEWMGYILIRIKGVSPREFNLSSLYKKF